MTATTLEELRQVLADKYEELKRRLTRRTGSEDLASEVLHETWLRLGAASEQSPVRSPGAYIFRSAINIAADRRRADDRRASALEISEILDVADETSDPARSVEARLDLEMLEHALEELTDRRRTILLASRLHGYTLRQIAERLQISQRMVEIELKHALEHCAERLKRKLTRHFGPQGHKTS
jgi:RNA polymerase sigma factor (sigma-70 family)